MQSFFYAIAFNEYYYYIGITIKIIAMIRFQEIKVGDYVIAENAGDKKWGEVTDLNRDSKQACVDVGAQEFWYEAKHLDAIPLNHAELEKLQFHAELNLDGSVKYKKGAFRILIPVNDDFTHLEVWYRDERRIIGHPIFVHELQNHFYEMTKVHLTNEAFA